MGIALLPDILIGIDGHRTASSDTGRLHHRRAWEAIGSKLGLHGRYGGQFLERALREMELEQDATTIPEDETTGRSNAEGQEHTVLACLLLPSCVNLSTSDDLYLFETKSYSTTTVGSLLFNTAH
jgi:hypothetical protein